MKVKKATIISITGIVVVLTLTICFISNSGILNPIEHQLMLGYKYLEEGKYEEAILAFSKVIEIDDKNEEAYFGLADVYFKRADDNMIHDIVETFSNAHNNNINDDTIIQRVLEYCEKLEKDNSSGLLEFLHDMYDVTKNKLLNEKLESILQSNEIRNDYDKFSDNEKENLKSFLKKMHAFENPAFYENNYKFDCKSCKPELIVNHLMTAYGPVYLKERKIAELDLEEVENAKDPLNRFAEALDTQSVAYIKADAKQVDWILKNYYNVEPNHNAPTDDLLMAYYYNGFYYAFAGGIGDSPEDDIAKLKVMRLWDNMYYIETCFYYAEGLEEASEAYHVGISEPMYGIYKLKDKDGQKYWSYIKTDSNPIDILNQ